MGVLRLKSKMKRTFFAVLAICLFVACGNKEEFITILHTNDTHSCIEPEKTGAAGVVNRAAVIAQYRDSLGVENVLLFDCGDFSQGSLYYNVFKGELEIELMNAMGYDAGTIGNHEFDFGLENMARLFKIAEFPIVCANYDFTGTVCEGIVKPYTIIKRGGRKIGVFGLSPDPDGLVSKENYAGVKFLSPIDAAKRCVEELEVQGCDLVVCLSHLGWKINNEYNDEKLASATSGIDILLGGHSHDYFPEPQYCKNADGKNVFIQQMGKNGRYVGYVTVKME